MCESVIERESERIRVQMLCKWANSKSKVCIEINGGAAMRPRIEGFSVSDVRWLSRGSPNTSPFDASSFCSSASLFWSMESSRSFRTGRTIRASMPNRQSSSVVSLPLSLPSISSLTFRSFLGLCLKGIVFFWCFDF